MKKILIFQPYGGIGGSGQSLLDIVNSIDFNNFKVTIVLPKSPNNLSSIFNSSFNAINLNLIELDKPLPSIAHYSGASLTKINLLFWFRYFKIFSKIKLVKKIIENVNPDIIVINSMTLAWIGKYFNNYKLICFHRETYMDTLLNIRTKYLKNILIKHFTKIVFISNFDLNKTTNIKPNQAHLIPDSTKISENQLLKSYAINDLGLIESDINILFVGGYNRIKGLDILIKAINKLKIPNLKLILVPHYDQKFTFINFAKSILGLNYQIKISKLIKKFKLEKSIVKFRSQIDMSKFYSACDFVVFPSKYPHQSRPIYEAGAHKKTIIISDFNETSEYLKNGVNGLTFTPNSYHDLAKKIYILIHDQALRTNLEINNFNNTLKNHNIKFNRIKISSLFNSFL